MLPNTVKVAAKFSGGLFGGLILIAAIKQTKYQVFKRVIRFPSPAPSAISNFGDYRRRLTIGPGARVTSALATGTAGAATKVGVGVGAAIGCHPRGSTFGLFVTLPRIIVLVFVFRHAVSALDSYSVVAAGAP
jgi:hypothetical protein